MAARIAVVVSQHEVRSGQKSELEEEFVTRLLFENGLDATLVGDLKSIQTDSTDHLCIEGLKGDFVVASWESHDYVATHLERLAIGSFRIVSLVSGETLAAKSTESEIPSAKRVYFHKLDLRDSIDDLLGMLKKLVASKNVQVFNLGKPLAPKRNEGALPLVSMPIQGVVAEKRDAAVPVLQNQNFKSHPSAGVTSNGTAGDSGIARTETLPTGIVSSSTSIHEDKPIIQVKEDDNEFPNLDQLVDELDQFDL